jgi:hypothetical protein
MQSFAQVFKGNSSEYMIDYRSTEEVIVYRAIGSIDSMDKLNLNANYSENLNMYGEDFVTHELSWASHYGTYGQHPNQGVLIKYKLRANLLDRDLSMKKQEPYYVISRLNIFAAGKKNVSTFVQAVARINSDQDDNIQNRISEENDPRLKWLSSPALQKLKKQSGI